MFILPAQAQQLVLGDGAQVSILTMGPGTELYDSFGHSAFRVKDSLKDMVFNYGEYDFDTPNFYTKFARGKLLYQIGVNEFQPFFNYYKSQNRSIKEQVLNLTYAEKEALFEYLLTNAQPENKKYKYDFFYDNCATKIRDVLKEILGDKLQYTDNFVKEDQTFRELIQQNLNKNSWGSLGIDIGLGAVVDKNVPAWDYQFLPEYIYQAAQSARILKKNNDGDGFHIEPFIISSDVIFDAEPIDEHHNFFTSPLFVFGLLGMVILIFTIFDLRNATRSVILDTIIFSVTGLIGIFLMLLWFATDHTATSNNYNLLWACPVNLLVLFFIGKKNPSNWVRRYVLFLILMLALLAIHWITGVQGFAIGLLPLLIALGIRYVYLFYYFGTITTVDKNLQLK